MNTPMIFAQAAAPAAPTVQAAAPSAPAPVTATEVQPAGAGAPQAPQPQQGGFMMPVMMLLLMGLTLAQNLYFRKRTTYELV